MNNDEFTSKIVEIKKEFQELGKQVSELASMSTEHLEGYRDQAMGEVQEMKEQASREVKKHVKQADEFVRSNPWAVIAGASVIGLILGVIISQTKKK
ncbi:MAG TPA: hypothetical protein VLG69_03790 [Candidatus Andersenbacteria bacterium]|nr:hypothetical protein [Candidatus Andersenbacteria bacterium]